MSSELQDSSTPDNESSVEKTTPEVQQSSANKSADLESKNRDLLARARKAEEKAKEYRERLVTLEQKPSSVVSTDLKKDVDLLKTMAKGYSEEEANFILSAGGENSFVKAGIDAMRAKAKVEQAQPSASQVVAPSEPSKAESWKELSNSDRAKIWDDALSRVASRRSGQPI